jgi:plasmid stabilization system protein ParE
MALPIFRLSRRAVSDLEQIVDYLGTRNPSATDRVIEELFNTFEALVTDPGKGMSLEELRPKLRISIPSKPASNYLVFYYVVADGVMVSRVLHAARDWMSIFSRGEI